MDETDQTGREPPVPPVRPWNIWATLGLGAGVFVLFLGVQAAVVVGASLAAAGRHPEADMDALTEQLARDGDLLAVATCATTLVCTGLILLLLRAFKRPILPLYLALTPVSVKTLVSWLGIGLLFALFCDRLTDWAGRPVVPEFMVQTYRTADLKPLLWFALIVAAPVFEETFFRGFLFSGVQSSRLGAPGSVALTALIWAAIHLQYHPFEMLMIFLIGLLLGVARLRTRSLYTPLAIHAGINTMATVQAMLTV
jgi:membrane protease YdiL (CAAX protease family)